jgi:hypothetical protein
MFQYSEHNQGITITKYLGKESHVTIPGQIDGKPVRVVGDEAFRNNNTITNVILPETLLEIGWKAFDSCSGLLEVDVPKNVIKIESNAFMNCKSLERVKINCEIEQISIGCFKGCTSLVTVELPETIKHICNYAFAECPNVTNLFLPSGLESIQLHAFDSMKTQNIPKFPDSLERLESRSFPTISGLTFFDAIPKANYDSQEITVIHRKTNKIYYQIWYFKSENPSIYYDKNGMFSLEKYDQQIAKFDLRSQLLTAISRLKYPHQLSVSNKQVYINALREVAKHKYIQFINANDLESITFWNSFKTISRKSCDELIDYAAKQNKNEITTLLLNYKNKTFVKKEKEYEL